MTIVLDWAKRSRYLVYQSSGRKQTINYIDDHNIIIIKQYHVVPNWLYQNPQN